MERSGRSSKNQGSTKATHKSSSDSSHSSKASSRASSGKKENQSLLKEFFVEQLQDIYWAEKHLVKELPKLRKATTTEELAEALTEHLSVTEEQVSRLEEVFDIMGETAKAKKCEAMDGITKEAHSIIDETREGTSTRDAAIIMAAQKVEHYEIATYGGLVQLAKTIGLNDVAELLSQTLEEEKEADETLSTIAESSINEEGAREGNDDEEEEGKEDEEEEEE
jgi:ferritin-like metal-binding protein YciE